MRHRTFIAILTGTVLIPLLQWANDQLVPPLVNVDDVSPFSWRFAVLTVLVAVAAVAPGACAGWIARKRPVVVGVAVGIFGSLLRGPTMVIWNAAHGGNRLSSHSWNMMFAYFAVGVGGALIWSVVGALAGVQLSSNKALERGHVR